AFNDTRFAPDLDASSARVIDEEQTNPGIFREISLSDVLAIADEIGKADGFVVEHMQEAGRAAAVLDVRLTLRVRGGDEDAGLRRDKCREVGRNPCRPRATLIHALVKAARTLARLYCLDARRKDQVARAGAGVHGRAIKGRGR